MGCVAKGRTMFDFLKVTSSNCLIVDYYPLNNWKCHKCIPSCHCFGPCCFFFFFLVSLVLVSSCKKS